MKLTFEPNLQFQLDAIKSVTDLFIGQSANTLSQSFQQSVGGSDGFVSAVANQLNLSDGELLKNLQKIQKQNELQVSSELTEKHFSVEMETGTGKTYVYLRTIYELHELYGFKKFVIVVPSVAIREGVIKNLQVTHEHFQNLYDHTPINYQVYDSKKLSALRSFTSNNVIDVLVINIDSFAKDENIINQVRESGQKPIELIQQCQPIVIVDEPQNMETEKRVQAIKNLNPLCTLRYSATHRNVHNLVYSLNPVKAYDLGLVKQIEVDSIVEEDSFNTAFVELVSINRTGKSNISATLNINCNSGKSVKKKKVRVKIGDDLFKLSKQRENYRNGYQVDAIDLSDESVMFSNGEMLYVGETQGGMVDEIMKFQIQKTIEEHLRKEKKYQKLGIKVLSLFFIDKVANYRVYDEAGNPQKGSFAQWFEEIYSEYINKPAFKGLNRFEADEVHDGYFAQDKKGKIKDTRETAASRNSKDAIDTYSRILKDKEKLLDNDESLRFIFSHSALREGWDNPNVFQICTLNETKSTLKKRQEIGRGLRLAVDHNGKRTYDKNINRLTVIANESYQDFAKTLQTEITEDCGVEFKDRVKNKNQRKQVTYRKGFTADPEFLAIWDKIKKKTSYRVEYDTADLIVLAAKALSKMEQLVAPTIHSTKVQVGFSDEGIETQNVGENRHEYNPMNWQIPDVLAYIQNRTELTRSTLHQILLKSNRLTDLLKNPQLFMDKAVKVINQVLFDLMIDGIKYQQLAGESYEMTLFEAQELEVYLNQYSFTVNHPDKTIYQEFMPLDSDTELEFAKTCEANPQVRFYFKLPNWFKIPTPIGNYNPDWAVVIENDLEQLKLYFVVETKNTGDGDVDIAKLSTAEQLKVKCGMARFQELNNVNYKVVKTMGQI
jgi:type III restriction enzyme